MIANLQALPDADGKIPQDGSARIRVHYVIVDYGILEDQRDAIAKAVEPSGVSRKVLGLACKPFGPAPDLSPKWNGEIVSMVLRSNEIGAVTCPECQASAAYQEQKKREQDRIAVPQG